MAAATATQPVYNCKCGSHGTLATCYACGTTNQPIIPARAS